jgi:hypothetical protein
VVIPLPRRVPGRASGPSRSRVNDGGGLKYVFWKIDWVLRVFLLRRIYRRKGDVRRWAMWPDHLVAQDRGRSRVTPQNRHIADYSDHATIYMMSLWKRTTKRLVHVGTCTRCGWNQGSNSYTSSRWNPQKNM